MKASPSPVTIKHYKDGEYHKDYDRQMISSSFVNFLRDPAGDIPWEEDESGNGNDVVHLTDPDVRINYRKLEISPNKNIIFLGAHQTFKERISTTSNYVLCTLVWLLQENKT